MTETLLLFSYLIHTITLVALFFIYRQMTTQKNKEVSEIYEVFEVFLEELKLENKKLLQQRTTIQHSSKQQPRREENIYTEQKRQPLKPFGEDDHSVQKDSGYSIEKLIQSTPESETELEETSLLSRVLYLQEKGHSIEQIAKELNRGKTEIELLIKLGQ